VDSSIIEVGETAKKAGGKASPRVNSFLDAKVLKRVAGARRLAIAGHPLRPVYFNI